MSSAFSRASAYKGPVGSLRHRCSHCSATGVQLLRCSGCHTVRYCNREHQAADRPRHKSECNRVKKERKKLSEEEDLVRHAEEDFMNPRNAFETHVGHFWGIIGTRDYMRERFALADHLRLLGTLDNVHEALDHLRDMLRLCRSDNMGVRDMVPALLLRLDLDQECYDFVKWWQTCGQDAHYDWGDMTLPYIHLHEEDVLESSDFFSQFSSLSFIVAILLLKLKLLVDVRNLRITRKILTARLPTELQDMIELAVIRNLPPRRRLFETNDNFMFNLFDPDSALCSRPHAYSSGSWEEMALTMQYSYAAFWETEGVLDLLKDARECGVRDFDDGVKDKIKDQLQTHNTNDKRTVKEVLEVMSVGQIWRYLDDAVENTSYLGPWSERPSEQHSRENKFRVGLGEDEEFDW